MFQKTFCFVLFLLVVSYEVEAFTAGAGNIGRSLQKVRLKDSIVLFRILVVVSHQVCSPRPSLTILSMLFYFFLIAAIEHFISHSLIVLSRIPFQLFSFIL